MRVAEIRNYLLDSGAICGLYKDRVSSSGSKSALMDMISDANGIEFVTAHISTDVPVDYRDVLTYFSNHINGARVFEHSGADGGRYTSEIYCGYAGTVTARSTMLALWGCDVTVVVPDGKMVEISCDAGTSCRIECKHGARVACVYWGEKPECAHSDGSVKFINKAENV